MVVSDEALSRIVTSGETPRVLGLRAGMRDALEAVKYNGWLTIEDGGLPLEDFRKRLDLIIAGK